MTGRSNLDLSENWTLVDSQNDHKLNVTLPADVHSVLATSRIIGDPSVTPDETFRWVHQRDWILSRTANLCDWPTDAPSFLEFEGVDAIAEVFWNGEFVGRCDNAFRRWRFRIRPTTGQHTLEIRMYSSENEAQKVADQIELVPPSPGHNRVKHMNLLRKPQCHSGWDWAPCVPVMGVVGDCRLTASPVSLDSFDVAQQFHGDACEVTVSLQVERYTHDPNTIEIELADEKASVKVPETIETHQLTWTTIINHAKRWNPVGYGDQDLYQLTIRCGAQTHSRWIGLRELEIRRPLDKDGRGLTIVVNNHKIFARGANWIPSDTLPSRQTPAKAAELLDAAVAANFNMIRIWGGGQYEPDWFYDACSERGLLVWQDFMFACAPYPNDPAFLANVRIEAEEQVSRLRSFPCIALFCGDNECLQSLEWYPESRDNREPHLAAYTELNHLLAKVTNSTAPQHQFWPSSPCPGPEDFPNREPDSNSGDSHCWEIWHGGRPFSDYRSVRPRFCSEFGFQSLPSPEQARHFTTNEHVSAKDPELAAHQRCPRGNGLITQTINNLFSAPTTYAATHYYSEAQQAMAIETAVAAWRTDRPRCAGVLYWQLNDVWPASSWSSIEHCGRWKQLHYRIRRAYAPTALFIVPDDAKHTWTVFGIHDGAETVTLKASSQLMTYSGKVIDTAMAEVALEPGRPTKLADFSSDNLLGHAPTDLFIRASSRLPNGDSIDEAVNLATWKSSALCQSKISVKLKGNGTTYQLALASERPAFHVTCEFSGISARFSDNSISLIPNIERCIDVTLSKETDLEDLRAALTIRHLAAPDAD